MGLDQYAYLTRDELTKNSDDSTHIVRQFYWRKHARLQAFFEHLIDLRIIEPLDPGSTFNCNPVPLNMATIDALESLIKDDALDGHSGGFFFGDEVQDERAKYYKDDDLEFCHAARDALTHGDYVYYDCWY